MLDISVAFKTKLTELVSFIYPEHDCDSLIEQIIEAYWEDSDLIRTDQRQPSNIGLWSEDDAVIITYGNSIKDGKHKPLDLLQDFLRRYLGDTITSVHILPFFPFTSDDGFAVTDYRSVNSELGEWEDIKRIGKRFKLMSDLVLNHVSSQSKWFNDYRQGHEPYDKFFFEARPDDDLSEVVRPRTNELLREVQTPSGSKHVWCTFSHDQVDVDFTNPEVLLEFLRIMRLHVDNGVRIIRLDAVAFIWKEIGTNCIHLPQTHAIVQLMRLLLDFAKEDVILLTETNVPNTENLSYFGNRNEAHAVYNFSLPPLILQALLSGSSRHLNQWQMAMPPAQMGCAYLNFSASHDGIGMRPAEGLLNEEEINDVIETVKSFGGLVSMRSTPDGGQKPYELNVTFFDALKGTLKGEDDLQLQRFLCSQSIVMALEGIPAFYIHSLIGTHNHMAGVEKTGINRAINRRRWNYPDLRAYLDDENSSHARVLSEMTARIQIRRKQEAFHPNATQFTMQLGDDIFGFWRQSYDRSQSIFALHNVTDRELTIPAVSINLIGGHDWFDLLSGEKVNEHTSEITFAPYQCRWITNRSK
ncbi:sugar phosphorylase [Hirschia baltica]|uniref:Alpha amylase catalytic region n=1 Tax=Hirschia baltica (strain ATCC 49814 / DSM 5838 / IFAM 1418) TaxID=582402 RepID=C6XKJ1_HIRBI|nr:sugar phosphorylase [Hirschia baltica]ACT59558.1 alpha amylase catalytic region [Hirschia baltica ATCC 49814]